MNDATYSSRNTYVVRRMTNGFTIDIAEVMSTEDAARIAAALNACAGISTEQLEKGCLERLLKASTNAADWLSTEFEGDAGEFHDRETLQPLKKALASFGVD